MAKKSKGNVPPVANAAGEVGGQNGQGQNGHSGKGITQNGESLDPLDLLESLETVAIGKLVSLDSIPIEKTHFLVPDLIPFGSITILCGEKGEAKSTVLYDLAARLTSGSLMPLCGGEPVSGGAIILQTEDDLGGTVRASVEAAGGDSSKVRVFTKFALPYLDKPDHFRLIAQAAEDIDAKLLVADPFSEFFSKTLKDEKVIRQSFRLIRALAAERKMAVVFVGHPTKAGTNLLYRCLGGVAVTNAARAVLVVGPDPSSDDPYQHVLAFHRGNLPRARNLSLIYRTVKRGDAITVEWLGESKYSAGDLFAANHNADAHSQLQEACYVLYSILKTHDKPLPATEVFKAAQKALVAIATLKRAKKLLKVRSRRKSLQILGSLKDTDTEKHKDGDEHLKLQTVIGWVWELPNDEELLRPYSERFERENGEDEAEQQANHEVQSQVQPQNVLALQDGNEADRNVGLLADTPPHADSAAEIIVPAAEDDRQQQRESDSAVDGGHDKTTAEPGKTRQSQEEQPAVEKASEPESEVAAPPSQKKTRKRRSKHKDDLVACVHEVLKKQPNQKLDAIATKVLKMGYKTKSQNLSAAVYNVLGKLRKDKVVAKDAQKKTYSLTGVPLPSKYTQHNPADPKVTPKE